MMTTAQRALPVIEQPEPSALPPLYAEWIERILAGPLPNEPHATCHDCAMSKPAGSADTASTMTFSPNAKCCTFTPMLPNFLVGGILDDESPENARGRAGIERRIDAHEGVTPIGLSVPPDYSLIYEHVAGDLFGKSVALRCPHFVATDGGSCGIWRHRNSTCSTYFCKFVRGATGKAFWDALHRLLAQAEYRLAVWSAAELCGGIDRLGAAIMTYAVRRVSDIGASANRCGWDEWADTERELYRRAWHLIRGLPWNQLAKIAGLDRNAQLSALRRCYEATTREADLPDHMRLGAIGVTACDGQRSILSGYDQRDMLIVPTAVATVLRRFDGLRRTADVVAESETYLDPELLHRLVDFQVLVPIPPPSRANGNAMVR
jgi:Fe-S-cluster containining protein